jgi:hypothetical protein
MRPGVEALHHQHRVKANIANGVMIHAFGSWPYRRKDGRRAVHDL